LTVSYFLRSRGDSQKDQARVDEKGDLPGKETCPAWYEVLEVPATATPNEIKSAYRRQIQKYHPDKVSSLGAELQSVAHKKTQEITAAYHQGLRSTM
jgi:DnaJ-class molecular chaperone